ncbi:4-oxalocrotonate tautomerase family protein [Chitinophaga sp. Mgbs1]|uniref:Tautomerase n=1 Tax=Chitinophaga solisilvae TaxID=1233460 RepID=A0A433WBU8_9BACT|nr:4-oxalocrotonate tautomerase family protein [Chitinophaga solisilvae]
MPFVNIHITRDGVSKEQKQQLISGVTRLLEEVLQKSPALTHIIITETDTDNWGVGGEQVTEMRKRK